MDFCENDMADVKNSAPVININIPQYEYYYIGSPNNRYLNLDQYVSDDTTQDDQLFWNLKLLDAVEIIDDKNSQNNHDNKIDSFEAKKDDNGGLNVIPNDSNAYVFSGFVKVTVKDKDNAISNISYIPVKYGISVDISTTAIMSKREQYVIFDVYDPNRYFIDSYGSVNNKYTSNNHTDGTQNYQIFNSLEWDVTSEYDLTVTKTSDNDNVNWKVKVSLKSSSGDNSKQIYLQLRNNVVTGLTTIKYNRLGDFYEAHKTSQATIEYVSNNIRINDYNNAIIFVNETLGIYSITINPTKGVDGKNKVWHSSAKIVNAYDNTISYQLDQSYNRYDFIMDGGEGGLNLYLDNGKDVFVWQNFVSPSLTNYTTMDNKFYDNIHLINTGNGDDIIDLSANDNSSMTLTNGVTSIQINGGNGNDVIMAGNNNTVIIGGNGGDTIVCGPSRDIVKYNNTNESDYQYGIDTIIHFSSGDALDIASTVITQSTPIIEHISSDEYYLTFVNIDFKLYFIDSYDITVADIYFAT